MCTAVYVACVRFADIESFIPEDCRSPLCHRIRNVAQNEGQNLQLIYFAQVKLTILGLNLMVMEIIATLF